MTQRPIVFGQPWFGEEEEQLLLQTLRSGWIGQGPLVEEFERRLAAYVGAEEAVAVSSCTAALHLSLLAAGVGPGDEVITTPFTFVATLNAIEHAGARPILVDIERETLGLSPAAVERCITERTRALLPVHFAGHPLDSDDFAQLAASHDLWVVEDAAHALGAVRNAIRTGGARHAKTLTCFSFYPNKNLASAEGGAITCTSSAIAGRLRELRLHGLRGDAWSRYRDQHYSPSVAAEAGFKYNWTDLQAAIALPQLERLEGFLATREALAETYDSLLESVGGVQLIPRATSGLRYRHALHLYQIAIKADPPARDVAVARLRQAGIGAAVHYVAVHHHPYYANRWADRTFPVSDWASSHLMSLPLHVNMHTRDVERVATELQAAITGEISLQYRR